MMPTSPLTPRDIALLEERRIASVFAETAPEHVPLAGGVVTFAGPASFANTALAVGLDQPAGPDEARAILDFHHQRGVDSRVELTPFADKRLTLALSELDYTIRLFENVFAIDLATPRPDAPLPPEFPALEIREIDPHNDTEADTFARIALSGFTTPEQTLEDMLPITLEFTRHPRARSLLAAIDGIPVAASAMEIHDELSALYGTTVVPNHRKRGIQQALIAHRLTIAKNAGSRLATISTEPGIPTERNAIRAGFSIAYTKVQVVRRMDPGS